MELIRILLSPSFCPHFSATLRLRFYDAMLFVPFSRLVLQLVL